MFKRKLMALNFTGVETFDAQRDDHCKDLILWLENQKINHLADDAWKSFLDASKTPEAWNVAVEEYVKSLKCPYSYDSSRLVTLDWLLGFAVRLEYSDNAQRYKSAHSEEVERRKKEANPSMISSNPLDKLDFHSEDFKKGVTELAKLLQVPSHPDHLITLKAVRKVIESRLSNAAVKDTLEKEAGKTEDQALLLDKFTLGFQTGDPVLDNAARILRLLHVSEIRDLQTQINETIVSVQSITANPKTDERLGKVGR